MTNYVIYRLFDYETGSYIGPEFSRLYEFFRYHMKHTFQVDPRGWGMDKFLDTRYKWQYQYAHRNGPVVIHVAPRKPGMFQNRYTIKDAYGKSYDDPQELYRLRNGDLNKFKGWRRYYVFDDERAWTLPKKNMNKIKREPWSWWYREIRTSNEHRQNCGHVRDHGEIIVRAKRRGYNLPNTWDDLPNSRWTSRKCWKHNSKRPHQWKEK